MAQTRTIKQALDDAALEGFASHVNTFDAGQTITLTRQGTPDFRWNFYWDEEANAVTVIDNYVAKYSRRREDDPRVQHVPVTTEGY